MLLLVAGCGRPLGSAPMLNDTVGSPLSGHLDSRSAGPIATRPIREAPSLSSAAGRSVAPEFRQAVFQLDGRTDRRIVYRDHGRTDARLTLVLLHGVGSSQAAWMELLPHLLDDHRVITLDLLGHGDSDKPVEFGYSMSEQAGIVRKLMRVLRLGDVVLVGHSYGAGVALELALDQASSPSECLPESSGTIRGAVLLDPSALYFDKPSLLSLMSGTSVSLLEALFSTEARARLLLEVSFWDRRRVPAALLAEYVRAFRDPRTTDVYLWIANKQLFKELAARRESEHHYSAVSIPVLVLWGEHDRVVPRAVFERLCGILPRADCQVVPNCGHSPAEEQPEDTAARIERFIARHIETSVEIVSAEPLN